MPDHYTRTFTTAGPATVSFPDFPFGAGRMRVSKVGGSAGDLWLSVGRAAAAAGGSDCIVIPDGVPSKMVPINGLLQREQHRASYPEWSFTVDWAGMFHVEVLDVAGLDPDIPLPPDLMYVLDLMYDPAKLMFSEFIV